MKCPACPDTLLVMTERSGVEIDYCPACRGVWLDRGELDKVIERSAAPAAPVAPVAAAPAARPNYDRDDRDRDYRRDDRDRGDKRDDDDDDRYRYGKKRKSMLGELFDF